MNNTQEFLKDLRTTAWRTAGARFNAARRLKRRDWLATFSIAMFSAISVALAVIQRVYSFQAGTPADNYVTTLAVCIGLFVVVISLIEWGSANAVKADTLHRNAEALNEFQRKLEQILAIAADGRAHEPNDITALREEYERIKGQCPYNHEPIDDNLFRACHRLSPEFGDSTGKPKITRIRASWVMLQSVIATIWYFSFFWFVILALLWATPW